jgi:acetolactate synthase regulatory subunit
VASEIVRNVNLVVDAIGEARTRRLLKTIKRGGELFRIFSMRFAAADEAERLGVTVSVTQVRSSSVQLAALAYLLDAVEDCLPLHNGRSAR